MNTILKNAVGPGIEKLQKYHEMMREQDIYFVASILDPRIKISWVRKHLPFEADEIIERIRRYLYTIFPFQPPLPAHLSREDARGLQLDMLDEFNPAEQNCSDIDIYIDSAPIRWRKPPGVRDEDVNQTEWIMDYWRTARFEFPVMAKIAQRFLAVPGSEVDVEHVFNQSRDLLGIRRYSLSAETMSLLVVLRDCLRREQGE